MSLSSIDENLLRQLGESVLALARDPAADELSRLAAIFRQMGLVEVAAEFNELHAARHPAVPSGEGSGRRQTLTTSTMAEIYVRQGYLRKAVHVYEELLRDDPGNPALAARLGELRAQLSGTLADGVAGMPRHQGHADDFGEHRGSADRARHLLRIFQSWLEAIENRRADVR